MAPPEPDPPINVRVIYADSQEEVPVDTVYEGQDEDGIHMWHVVNVQPERRVINLKVDELPPHTGVSIPWDPS